MSQRATAAGSREEREICFACKKSVALYYQKAGDGSLRILRKHRVGGRGSAYCHGSHSPEDR